MTTAIGWINDYAYSIAQQTDGKIVVTGNTGISYSKYGCATVRYNIDGSLDSTFGSGGIVITSLGLGSAIALQADSKIVVTGFVHIIRYNIDGSLDSTFGSGGIVTSAIGGVSSVAIQPNGKILAAGSSEIHAGDSDFAVVRYNTDGSLDSAFGSGGIATTPGEALIE